MNSTHNTPPMAPSVESGGATNSQQLQWMQTQLNRQTDEVSALRSTASSLEGKVDCIVSAQAEQKITNAIVVKDISSINEKIIEGKSSQVTVDALERISLRFLDAQHKQHVEFLNKVHEIECSLVQKITEAKEASAASLQNYSTGIESKQRWLIGILISLAVGVAAAYFRTKG